MINERGQELGVALYLKDPLQRILVINEKVSSRCGKQAGDVSLPTETLEPTFPSGKAESPRSAVFRILTEEARLVGVNPSTFVEQLDLRTLCFVEDEERRIGRLTVLTATLAEIVDVVEGSDPRVGNPRFIDRRSLVQGIRDRKFNPRKGVLPEALRADEILDACWDTFVPPYFRVGSETHRLRLHEIYQMHYNNTVLQRPD